MAKCDYCGKREARVELLERETDYSVGYIGYKHIADVCKECGEAQLDINDPVEWYKLGCEI